MWEIPNSWPSPRRCNRKRVGRSASLRIRRIYSFAELKALPEAPLRDARERGPLVQREQGVAAHALLADGPSWHALSPSTLELAELITAWPQTHTTPRRALIWWLYSSAGCPSTSAATTGRSSLLTACAAGHPRLASTRCLLPRAVPGKTATSNRSTESCGTSCSIENCFLDWRMLAGSSSAGALGNLAPREFARSSQVTEDR